MSASAEGLRIAVYDSNYALQGWLNDYESASVTWQHLDTGTGTVVLPESHPMAGRLLQHGTSVVPVVAEWNGQRWSGRVSATSIDEGDGTTAAPPGAGTLTVTLVDEWLWMTKLLASPNGADPSLSGMPLSDDRSGPLHTLTKQYLSDAVTREGLSSFVAVPPPDNDTSVSVLLSARWTSIEQLVAGSLRNNNFAAQIVVWLPGDDQPPGLALTQPTVVFDLRQGSNNPRITWTEATILSRTMAVTSPAAYRAILAGSGTDTDQLFYSYTDTALKQSLGRFGFPTAYFSQSQGGSTNPVNDARIQLLATEGGLAIQAAIDDGIPWSAFVDYQLGDMVGIEVLGLVLRQRITAIQVSDDRESGLQVTSTIGDDVATLTPQQKLARTVSDLSMRVNQIQTGI